MTEPIELADETANLFQFNRELLEQEARYHAREITLDEYLDYLEKWVTDLYEKAIIAAARKKLRAQRGEK